MNSCGGVLTSSLDTITKLMEQLDPKNNKVVIFFALNLVCHISLHVFWPGDKNVTSSCHSHAAGREKGSLPATQFYPTHSRTRSLQVVSGVGSYGTAILRVRQQGVYMGGYHLFGLQRGV